MADISLEIMHFTILCIMFYANQQSHSVCQYVSDDVVHCLLDHTGSSYL